MADNREQMNKWLRASGLIALYLIQVIGAIGGLFAIFGRDNVISYLEQYLPIFLIIIVIIVAYGWVAYLVWRFARDIWIWHRNWMQRQRDIQQLKALAKDIAFAKQLAYWRIAQNVSSEKFDWMSLAIGVGQVRLSEQLTELAIPYPEPPEKPSRMEILEWGTYLDMLLPLAVVGDIDEARMVLDRVSPSPEDSLPEPLFRRIWKAIRDTG